MLPTNHPDLTAADAVDIVPGVGILGVFGHLNYEPWFALAEYVDNALQSAAKSRAQLRRLEPRYRLRVDIAYEREDGGRLVIEDNAGGIARSDFGRAFKAAEIPPDRSGLSEFGMGMKSASIWFARNWRVVTTSPGDPNVYTVEFDMDTVLSNKVERLEVEQRAASVDDHYTRLELWNLNQFLHGRTLGKVRDHLREIYRAFLRDDRLILWVGGQNLEYAEPEVLKAADYRAGDLEGVSDEVVEWRKDVSFTLDRGVKVEGWAAIRAEGRTSGNGLSLFRRGRVIVGTSDAPYRPIRVFGQSNSYRSQRLFGELTVEGLPVSHTKDGFQWHGDEEEFEDKLRKILDADPLPLLKQAEGYRARQATRAEQQRIQRAADNTADVSEKNIPAVLGTVIDPGSVSAAGSDDLDAENDSPLDVSREFSFEHGGTAWSIVISATSRPADARWLLRQVDFDSNAGSIRAALTLNTAHPFISQFTLGSTDALEAVFRLAVALVVSESLLCREGDGETAARFLRQVDTLLGAALSKRLRSDT
ncbi:MAG: ATP-binding protein [Frankiaceae bacterium]|nr:ATP-binding protein [Frankiaceae bacterium]MBV9369401.1 ATP-binding protein [Frankiales bacterium]